MMHFPHSKIVSLIEKNNQVAHSKLFAKMEVENIKENFKIVLQKKKSHTSSLLFILQNKIESGKTHLQYNETILQNIS